MAKREDLSNKRFIAFWIIVLSFPFQLLSQDLIIFRNGSEKSVKITMVTNDKTTFSDITNKAAPPQAYNNTSIYMIKYEKRGNVFFTDDGKRLTGEGDGKVPASATAIYLLEGKEIVAYNVSIEEGNVTYYNSKKKGTPKSNIPSDKVFLIKYPDGTRDLMNTFEDLKRREAEALAEKKRLEEEARLAEIRNRYPKDAIIKTQKNLDIKVSLLSENDAFVRYKKTNLKNSPIFNMDRTNIKEIKIINE